MDEDEDKLCPEKHIDSQDVCFPDGHAQVLQRDMQSSLFACPRCTKTDRNCRLIQLHASRCDASATALLPRPALPLPDPPAPTVPAQRDVDDAPPPPIPLFQPTTRGSSTPGPTPSPPTTPTSWLITLLSSIKHTESSFALALDPSMAYNHISSAHDTLVKPPPSMIPALVKEYEIQDPAKIPHSTDCPAPTFGLCFSPSPYFECGNCAHAYLNRYAQRFTAGPRNAWFLVDLEKSLPAPEVDFAQLVALLDLGVPDYDTQHLAPTAAESKKDILIAREGWDVIMRKMPPRDVRELTRLSTPDDEFHGLGPSVVGYIARLQPQLRKYFTYGQQHDLADYGVQQDSLSEHVQHHHPRELQALWPHPLVVGVQLAQASRPETTQQAPPLLHHNCGANVKRSWRSSPISDRPAAWTMSKRTIRQHSAKWTEDEDIEILDDDESPSNDAPHLLVGDIPSSLLDKAIQRVALALFRHEQTGLHDRQVRLPVLTATVKQYHTNGFVTPLSSLFQLFTLLKVIAQSEIAPIEGRWHDLSHQTVDWNGILVQRHKLQLPYDSLIKDIQGILAKDVFFGKPIPPDLAADFFKGINITDPAMNPSISPGWLISQPDLRDRFTYFSNGEIQWRPIPVKQLMHTFDLLSLKIALAHDMGSPSLCHAKQMAELSLRNTIGSTTRNFQIILNTVTLVSLLDKTSQKQLSYRLIPSASLALLSRYMLQLLVFFQPAQIFFAQRFFGIEAAHRFHTCHVAPRRRSPSNTTGVALRITLFRKFVAFWLKEHVSPELRNNHSVVDRMLSHSTNTAAKHYDQDVGVGAGISVNDVHLMLAEMSLPLGPSASEINEASPLAEHYRQLVQHYDDTETDTLPGDAAATTINLDFKAMSNNLITMVSSRIREEMILQQAILPTLPPVYAFHELRDVSNIRVLACNPLLFSGLNLPGLYHILADTIYLPMTSDLTQFSMGHLVPLQQDKQKLCYSPCSVFKSSAQF
ncbi:hypothetical protein DFH06DRAFT_1486822 [Mycena polygramma]|nr:hypothetical protein DFH06DRAFT_1486822 [Mycena polygramma]